MTSDLITRLSKLDAPDREVDWEIQQFFMGEWLQKNGYRREGDHYRTFTPPLSGTEICSGPEHYTASVDAAIALAERVFPGTEYEFTNLYNIVRVTIEMNGEYGGFHGEHINSLPIAICIALLRAKEANHV